MNLQNQIDYLREYGLGDMFDECSVPSGLDMARVRGAIIMRCGLLTPLFSEPETQRAATQQFFFENQWNFEHILKIVRAEYSPIENVAEWRDETTKNTGADTLTISKNSTETHSGTDTNGGQDRTERKISAENVTTYSPDNEETDHFGKTFTHGHKIATGGSDQHKTEKGSQTEYSVTRHGNIGVTTNQDMMNQELDLLERFNPYRFIADMYEKELILGLY